MSDRSGGLTPRHLGRRTLLKARARPRKEVVASTSKQGHLLGQHGSSRTGGPGPSRRRDDTICDIADRPTSSASSSLEANEPSDIEEGGSTTASDEEEEYPLTPVAPSTTMAPSSSGMAGEVANRPPVAFDPAAPGPSGTAVIKKPKKSGSPPVDPKKREEELLGPRRGEDLTPEQKTDLLITNCRSLGDNQHECCMCDKKIRGGLTHLRMHMRTHTGHRPYKCDLCGAQFVQRAQLRAHSICHSELRPFACQVCGKRFKRAESVKDHMKVHTGEKPFKCSYCERWFGHKCDVVKHERVHTGEKPYSCQHCGRAFSQKGALRVHIRTHTKERPYACPHKNCDKAFPILSSLQRHLCKHSGTKPFACDLCPVSFFTQTHLKRHRKTHFEGQPDAQEGAGSSSLALLAPESPAISAPSSGASSPVPPPAMPPLIAAPIPLLASSHPGPPELRCEKCQKTFVHYARWQRHMAMCSLEAEQPPAVPEISVPEDEPLPLVKSLSSSAGPSSSQPPITSVFHPKKFRRHPPPLMTFTSKQGDEIEVGLVQKRTSEQASPETGSSSEVTLPEVTIEPRVGETSSKVPSQGLLPFSATEPGGSSASTAEVDPVGPSGPSSVEGDQESPTAEIGTVVFLNREVTIRKLLPSKK